MTNIEHWHLEKCQRIETPRLFLRPVVQDDSPLIVEWRSDPVDAALFFGHPPTLEDQVSWCSGPRYNRVDYMICEKSTGNPVGTVNLKSIDLCGGRAESGKLIGDKRVRGQGYAREACGAFYMYGFVELHLQTIYAQTRADNAANIHLNTRLGYVQLGTVRKRAADGAEYEFQQMRLDRDAVLTTSYYREIDCHGFVAAIAGRGFENEET